MTILLVEQNAARAVELADRSYVLRTGQISLAGTREELQDAADLRDGVPRPLRHRDADAHR